MTLGRTAIPRRRRRLAWARDDRGEGGGTALEFLLLTPLVLVFGLLIVAGYRYAINQQTIDSAAASAARAATQQTTAEQAQQVALEQASAALAAGDVSCQTVDVDVDTGGFAATPGTAATVTATVTCQVSMADLSAVPNLPGTITLTGRAVSPLDVHREIP